VGQSEGRAKRQERGERNGASATIEEMRQRKQSQNEFMLPRLLGADVQLTFEHPAARSWILADPSQLQQVTANLAINARDAMPCGGKLTISTSNAKELPANVSTRARRGACAEWLVLEVKDTGSGMDEATRNHIFEPFFTTKPVGKGTGLGLSTVYGIVHQFGGRIQLESQLGAGTRFAIHFPMTEPLPSAPKIRPQPKGELQDPGIHTILLVDDEAALRLAVAEFLRSAGHEVLESQSALDTLELARNRGIIPTPSTSF
jgi:two-component system, cell cycle sensor histidine kinase and response regulator CckA